MIEEFCILFISHPGVNQCKALTVFYQQATERPTAHIVFICGIYLVPNTFRHYAEHCPTV